MKQRYPDQWLVIVDFETDDEFPIKPGLETQKYAKILLASVTICGHTVEDFKVMVSRFDPAWGIAALIGLDFFRRFKVTVDYGQGVLVCELLKIQAD